MADVIDREKLLYELRDLGDTWKGTFTYDGISMAMVKVKQAPAVDIMDAVLYAVEVERSIQHDEP